MPTKRQEEVIEGIMKGCVAITCLLIFADIMLLGFEVVGYPSIFAQVSWFIIILIASVRIGIKS